MRASTRETHPVRTARSQRLALKDCASVPPTPLISPPPSPRAPAPLSGNLLTINRPCPRVVPSPTRGLPPPRAAAPPAMHAHAAPPVEHTITMIPKSQWVPDGKARTCMCCQSSVFSFVGNRRHHCRVCGRVVCKDCTAQRHPAIPDQRICSKCYSTVRG